jgi:acetyltransferase-like isoleucine patch superfamily enzyme
MGFEVSPSAIIHSNLFVNMSALSIGEKARIRPWNVFRSISVIMEQNSEIGSWNWVTGAIEFRGNSDDSLTFILREGAQVTSRHYLDCSGGLELGKFALVAGVRSTFFSHQIDVGINKQTIEKINIGNYSLIGSNSKILPGAKIGSFSMVGMGAVITGKKYPNNSLIAGVPAVVIKKIAGNFFSRKESVVDV